MTGFESFKLGLRLLGIWWLGAAVWEFASVESNTRIIGALDFFGYLPPLLLGLGAVFGAEHIARLFWEGKHVATDRACVLAWNSLGCVLIAAVLWMVYLPYIVLEIGQDMNLLFEYTAGIPPAAMTGSEEVLTDLQAEAKAATVKRLISFALLTVGVLFFPAFLRQRWHPNSEKEA